MGITGLLSIVLKEKGSWEPFLIFKYHQ
jgi:hypothetical protein